MATPIDVAVWAARAGWRGNDLTVAVAVALAASRGNPSASGGLYGIGGGGDGQSQSNTAHARWKASGWGTFKAHNSRAYLLQMPAAGAAVVAAEARDIISDPAGAASEIVEAAGQLPGADVLDAAKGALTLAYKAGAWMANPDNWARVLMVVLGGGLVVGGLVMTVGSGVASPVGALAGKVIGGATGKAAAAAKKGVK